ncbi:MAG: hypothetical protein QHG99_08145 [Methanomicrobiales archaeon]|jgi:hypothetical protein|nr:hypothetical protein [Methanomicrobiales archaeon]
MKNHVEKRLGIEAESGSSAREPWKESIEAMVENRWRVPPGDGSVVVPSFRELDRVSLLLASTASYRS